MAAIKQRCYIVSHIRHGDCLVWGMLGEWSSQCDGKCDADGKAHDNCHDDTDHGSFFIVSGHVDWMLVDNMRLVLGATECMALYKNGRIMEAFKIMVQLSCLCTQWTSIIPRLRISSMTIYYSTCIPPSISHQLLNSSQLCVRIVGAMMPLIFRCIPARWVNTTHNHGGMNPYTDSLLPNSLRGAQHAFSSIFAALIKQVTIQAKQP